MKTGEVLQIGGGNIGRALIGQIMHEAGMRVVFADVNEDLVQSFNDEQGYPVNVVSIEGARQVYVDGVSAISSRDTQAMVDHIVSADLVTTAVGVGVLHKVAPTLALGLMARLKQRPKEELHMTMIACENIEHNTETLRDYVLATLPDDEWRAKILQTVSFPNCAVDRIVPNIQHADGHPLTTTTEDYFQLAVDETALLSDMPPIGGIELTQDLDAVLAQKLFTLNGAHAAVAYWAHLKGYETISQAMDDPDISALVDGLLLEVGVAVEESYPSVSKQNQQAFAAKIIRRFKNPYLQDDPKRVGRNPKRKLGSGDRLVRPALLALRAGEIPSFLSTAIVGALRFEEDSDVQAVELRADIRVQGIEAATAAVTGLSRQHPLVKQAVASYRITELTGA